MLTDPEREKLNDLRHMLGPDAGNLALALEQLTDAMAMVNLHGVYCRAAKSASGVASVPRVPRDIAEALQTLERAKGMVQETLQRLRLSQGPAGRST